MSTQFFPDPLSLREFLAKTQEGASAVFDPFPDAPVGFTPKVGSPMDLTILPVTYTTFEDDDHSECLEKTQAARARVADEPNPWLDKNNQREVRAYARAVAEKRAAGRPLSDLKITILES
jgi:hypothetical protein